MIIENLKLFLLIVDKGSMRAAAREYGLSAARVSERLSALEAYYDTRLLNRTTRSISVTEEGQELARTARRIIIETEEIETKLKFGKKTISGTIHLNATIDFGINCIAHLIDEFMELHPEININLTLDDGYVDLISNNIDLAIRLGELSDSTLHTKKIGINPRITCASPEYLQKYGIPKHPSELEKHNCLLTKFSTHVDRHWRFIVDGHEKGFSVKGNRISNNGELVSNWCRAGHGIAFKSSWDVYDDLKSGKLVKVLQEYEIANRPSQFVFAEGATKLRRVRLLMEHIIKGLEKFQT